jgi:hypothetical protein
VCVWHYARVISHSPAHSFTHSLFHSLTLSLTHSLTHSGGTPEQDSHAFKDDSPPPPHRNHAQPREDRYSQPHAYTLTHVLQFTLTYYKHSLTTNTHTLTHTHTHAGIGTCSGSTSKSMRGLRDRARHASTRTGMYVCMHVHVCVHVSICTCVYLNTHVYMYVCVNECSTATNPRKLSAEPPQRSSTKTDASQSATNAVLQTTSVLGGGRRHRQAGCVCMCMCARACVCVSFPCYN